MEQLNPLPLLQGIHVLCKKWMVVPRLLSWVAFLADLSLVIIVVVIYLFILLIAYFHDDVVEVRQLTTVHFVFCVINKLFVVHLLALQESYLQRSSFLQIWSDDNCKCKDLTFRIQLLRLMQRPLSPLTHPTRWEAIRLLEKYFVRMACEASLEGFCQKY
jgi:hypothetical protein